MLYGKFSANFTFLLSCSRFFSLAGLTTPQETLLRISQLTPFYFIDGVIRDSYSLLNRNLSKLELQNSRKLVNNMPKKRQKSVVCYFDWTLFDATINRVSHPLIPFIPIGFGIQSSNDVRIGPLATPTVNLGG